MTRRPRRIPPPDLVPDQFPELNRRFYSSNPADYFRRRLYLLAVYAGARGELTDILSNGISYEKLRFQADLSGSTDDDERAYQRFLIAEAEVLLHHASEALMRLYFAHLNQPPCPWLACARLRVPRDFKEKIENFLNQSEEECLAGVTQVFIGGALDRDNEQRMSAAKAVTKLLQVVSRRLLDDADLYNSAKHGFTVLADESSIIFGDADGSGLFGSQGPSVLFLQERKADDDTKRWHTTTRWVESRQAMWLTGLAIVEMSSLWNIAKHRYTATELSEVEVVTDEAVQDAITGDFASKQPITRSSFMLHYYPKE